jgi:ABC-type hemin transport system ATPase subunit
MRCDRVVVLREGRIEAQGTVDQVLAQSSWFADAWHIERASQRWRSLTHQLPAGTVVDREDVRLLLL